MLGVVLYSEAVDEEGAVCEVDVFDDLSLCVTSAFPLMNTDRVHKARHKLPYNFSSALPRALVSFNFLVEPDLVNQQP